MAAGPTLTVLRRERRRRRDGPLTDTEARDDGRTSPAAGLPLFLRSLGQPAAAGLDRDEDIDLSAESVASEVQGDQVSDATDNAPTTESQPLPPSTTEGRGGSAGETPPEERNSSGTRPPADIIAASGRLVPPTPNVSPNSPVSGAAPAPTRDQTAAPTSTPGISPVNEEEQTGVVPTAPIPSTPAAGTAPERGEAGLNQDNASTEPTTAASPDQSATASPESGEAAASGNPPGGAPPDGAPPAARARRESTAPSPERESAEAAPAGAPEARDGTTESSATETAEAEAAGAAASRDVASAESDLLTAPDIPLAGAASGHLTQIDASCDQDAESVRAEAAAKRQGVRDFFAEKRALVSDILAGSALAVVGYLDQKRASLAASLIGKAMAVQAFTASLLNSALALGIGVTSAIQGGVAAVTSLVVNGIGGVVDGALEIAESIPIPDLPGLGRIRNAVLNVARAVTARLRSALGGLQSFITAAVTSVVETVQSLMRSVTSVILSVITGFMSLIIRAITSISGQFAAMARQIRAVIQAIGRGMNSVLSVMEKGAVRQIHHAEAAALREIERSRAAGHKSVNQILEFCYASGDYPPDTAAHPHLDAVDNASAREDFESSALAAMAAVTAGVQLRNTAIVGEFRAHTGNILSLIIAAGTRYVLELVTHIGLAFAQVVGRVTQAAVELLIRIAGVVTDVLAALGRLISDLVKALNLVLSAIIQVVRAPVDALLNIGRAVISGVRSFLTRIISRLVSLFSSDSESDGVSEDAASLTGDLDQFGVSRLKAAARMSSPPALVLAPAAAGGAAVGVAAGGTAVALSTILFWVGLALLAIAVIILLYLLVQYLMAQPRAVPRAPARPKAPARPRTRRRRKPKTPLRWNPSLSMKAVIASGGVPGTLDTNAKLPARAPLHGHHVWPTYAGGPVVQPLMSVRDTVHISTVHPGLHAAMKASALSMGQDLTTNTTNPKNQAFIAHIHGNIIDRTVFAAVMTGFYVGLNAITSPPIPVPAYELGMTHSFPLI